MQHSNLQGKRVVLGVCGSIAAYKACIIASTLTKMGAQVDTIMTEAATRFVTPLTFQALTGRPVYTTMWETDSVGGLDTHIAHVGLAHEADVLLIAPITAQSLAKLALGLSDDLLGVTALAARCPFVVAPAMDAGMYENAATQAHVEALKGRGVVFAGPEVGRMASGYEGLGRFAEPETIIGVVRQTLGQADGPLRGMSITVSAGPTREALDPVRFLSNRSSGKQGYAIAQAALDAGAEVTLVSGPTALTPPVGVRHIAVTTAQQMHDAVHEHLGDVLIMAAAVSDFRPADAAAQKIKKADGVPHITLTANPDILASVAERDDRPQLVIGFAAESTDVERHAQDKLMRKKLDLIVANDVSGDQAGFEVDTNRVVFIAKDGMHEQPLMPKAAVAERLMAWIAAHSSA